MIVKMQKVLVASRQDDRDRLLETLRELGAVHLTPVDSARAKPAEEVSAAIDRAARARQILTSVQPTGKRAELSPIQAVDRTLEISQRATERQARLSALHRQLQQLEMWGDVRLEQFERLRQAGVDVQFFAVEPEQVGAVRGDLVQTVGEYGGAVLVAVASRQAEIETPEDAEPLDLPERDRPSIRAEAAELDRQLTADRRRLAELANLLDDVERHIHELNEQAEWSAAVNGSLRGEHIFAIQGWVPADRANELEAGLADAGIPAAVELIDPDANEEPPTLIRYPRWARPIKALFDLLGTVPGYREYDLSGFFMVALPIFAAMLFGDAGYGFVFTAVALGLRGKIIARGGAPAANLVLIFGLTTLAWGALTGNYFGVTPQNMIDAGSVWAPLGQAGSAVAMLWDKNPEVARNIIIKVSFIFGAVHLILGHLRQALGYAPNLRFVAELGWSSFLAGMLGLIWLLFFPEEIWMPQTVMFALLGAGAALVVLFSYPSRNPAKMLALGVVANILPMISTFSDTISYIRLMAVGLASYYIASAFNALGSQVAEASAILIPAGVLIIIGAHLLNIALGVIALFAHGVRLNMLEFSSNAGVQWTGYSYAPFARTTNQGEL